MVTGDDYNHPLSLLPSSLAGSQNSSLPDQALLIHCSAENIQLYDMHSVLLRSALEYTEHGGD